MTQRTTYEAAILREIYETERRIRHMGADEEIRDTWGLSGQPLRINIGADIECYAYDRIFQARIGTSGESGSRTSELKDAVHAICGQRLCDIPTVDSEALELNPQHGRARQIIRTYKKLQQEVAEVAKAREWDFVMGPGHWHLTIDDTGYPSGLNHLMSQRGKLPDTDAYSDFTQQLACNLDALHCIVPALFLRPSRAEKYAISEAQYTRSIGSSSTRQFAIRMVKEKYGPAGSLKFEMRMAHLAPHLPVLMFLHAVERTLLDHQISAKQYNAKFVTLRTGRSFVRGPGCHLEDIQTTWRTGYMQKHFPQLQKLLFGEIIGAYRTFLSDERRSDMYADGERVEALARLPVETTKLRRFLKAKSVVSAGNQVTKRVGEYSQAPLSPLGASLNKALLDLAKS